MQLLVLWIQTALFEVEPIADPVIERQSYNRLHSHLGSDRQKHTVDEVRNRIGNLLEAWSEKAFTLTSCKVKIAFLQACLCCIGSI